METQKSKIKRNSNFEAVRIICMLLIIEHHFMIHGIGAQAINGNLTYILAGMVRTAVGYFIVISGYFSINRIQGTDKHLVTLLADRIFYSIIISVFFMLQGYFRFNSLHDIGYSIFPDIYCRHNYIASFIALYLLMPYINRMVTVLSFSAYRNMIIVLSVVFCVWPAVGSQITTFSDNVYSYVGVMVYFYLLGGFIRKHIERIDIVKYASSMRLGGIICIALQVALIMKKDNNVWFAANNQGFLSQNSILVVATVVFIVYSVATFRPRNNRVVNTLAAGNFAVICIHDDPLIRGYAWNYIIPNKGEISQLPEIMFNLQMIVTVTGVFLLCVLLDLLYKHTLRKYWVSFFMHIQQLFVMVCKKVCRDGSDT